jgi:hypothetical protein
MRRVALTIIGWLVLASFFGPPAAHADDRGADHPGPAIVVDSRGKPIGTFLFVGRMSLPSSSVLREIEGTWYLLPFSTTGFSSTGVNIYYSEENCKGATYVAAFPDNPAIVPQAAGSVGIANGILYYPKPGSVKPFSKLVLKSQRMLNFQAKDVGCARIRTMITPFVGEMTTFELSKLGFVPPFTLIEKEQSLGDKHLSKKK